jgi:hypothetical protein
VALIGAFAACGWPGFHPPGYSQGAYAGLCYRLTSVHI